MAITYDTLFDGTNERTLAAWGFSLDSCMGSRNNLKADVFSGVVVTVPALSATQFAFEQQVTVYAGRVSASGADNSFSGGVCKFQGKCMDPEFDLSNNSVKYEFQNAVYDLEHSLYLQQYKGVANPYFPGELVLFSSLQNAAGSFYLPISVGDQIQSILQWVLDQYAAQGMAAPFQYVGRALNAGAIDLTRTGTIVPGNGYAVDPFTYTYAVPGNATIDPKLYTFYMRSFIEKPMMAMRALEKCLEFFPRTSMGFDYSTTPPTVYLKSIDNFPAVSLPVYDSTNHKSLRITPKNSLVAKSVVITYRINNTVGGLQEVDFAIDKWGKQGAGESATPDVTTGLRVFADTIDLTGFTEPITQATLDCEPIGQGLIGGNNFTKRAWWSNRRGGETAKFIDSRCRFQTLSMTGAGMSAKFVAAAATFPDAVITYATNGKDSTGANVVAGQVLTNADKSFYTARLVHGTHHSWMALAGGTPVLAVKVRATVRVPMVMYDRVVGSDTLGQLPAGQADETIIDGTGDANNTTPAGIGSVTENHATFDHHVDLDLTNGVTGNYSTYTSLTTGEAYIIGQGGIAQFLYDACKVLQYEGEHVRVSVDFEGANIQVTNCLNLTNGRTEWATMNAQIQSIQENYGTHETSVRIGVAKHLSAGQLSSLFNMLRNRRTWYNPNIRGDNTIGSSGTVSMPDSAGGANATAGAYSPAGQVHTLYNTPGDPTSGIAAQIDLTPGWATV